MEDTYGGILFHLSATTGWRHKVAITGLDPTKRDYMTVASGDSTKNVVVDTFTAVPYQG